jgi:hypothetical protein
MNQNFFRFRLTLISLMILAGLYSIAQISEGGLPLSFAHQNLKEQYIRYSFPKPDLEQLIIEDQINAEAQYPGPERMGISVPVDLDLISAGTSEILPDGTKIFRLKIKQIPPA